MRFVLAIYYQLMNPLSTVGLFFKRFEFMWFWRAREAACVGNDIIGKSTGIVNIPWIMFSFMADSGTFTVKIRRSAFATPSGAGRVIWIETNLMPSFEAIGLLPAADDVPWCFLCGSSGTFIGNTSGIGLGVGWENLCWMSLTFSGYFVSIGFGLLVIFELRHCDTMLSKEFGPIVGSTALLNLNLFIHMCFNSFNTCSSTPSSLKDSRTPLTTSSITDA